MKKQQKKAWFIAGLFEWPLMAFMGIALGLFVPVLGTMFLKNPSAKQHFIL